MLNGKAKILSIVLCMVGILIGISSVGIAESPSIVRYSTDWPLNIDPAVGSNDQDGVAMVNLYDPLVVLDTEENVIPHVAERWDISSDGLTYTFYLHPGIKFHEGSELTAEDVKFSMDRALRIGEGMAYLWLDNIQETEVIDKYTVVFHMKKSFGPFLVTLPIFYIVNKNLIMSNIEKPGSYGDMGDYGKKYASDYDVGSGPYMIKSYDRSVYLHMEKNPNYFLDISSAPDEFRMIAATESALLKTMMSRRELELTNMWLSSEAFTALDKIEGVGVVRWLNSGLMEYIYMNTKKPPLDDIHVRKALAWAFDYDTCVGITAGSVQARGPVPLTIPGSDPNSFQYHRDIEKAKEELKKSKYYGHFDEYPMECQWLSNVSKQKAASILMASAYEIGLTVNVTETTWVLQMRDLETIETTPHFLTMAVLGAYPEAGALLKTRYHSITAGTWEQGEWLLDPALDKMIDDAIATVDENERYAKYIEITKYIVDLCPTIYLIELPEAHAYQETYVDWPAARGEVFLSRKYNECMRYIKVYPEKREELLKK